MQYFKDYINLCKLNIWLKECEKVSNLCIALDRDDAFAGTLEDDTAIEEEIVYQMYNFAIRKRRELEEYLERNDKENFDYYKQVFRNDIKYEHHQDAFTCIRIPVPNFINDSPQHIPFCDTSFQTVESVMKWFNLEYYKRKENIFDKKRVIIQCKKRWQNELDILHSQEQMALDDLFEIDDLDDILNPYDE